MAVLTNYQDVFRNRTGEDFVANAQKIGSLQLGDNLGWDENFNPEVYSNRLGKVVKQGVRKIFDMFDSSRVIYGHGPAKILEAWAERFETKGLAKDNPTLSAKVSERLNSLATAYLSEAFDATKISIRVEKDSIGKIYKTVSDKLEKFAPKSEGSLSATVRTADDPAK